MTNSALVAHPPANDRDLAIVKGILAGVPQLAGKWSPEKGSPPSPLWPPPAERNSDSTGGSIVASSVVVILVVSIVTGTRIIARWSGKHNRIGWDDYFIIVAAVELPLQIAILCTWTDESLRTVISDCMGRCYSVFPSSDAFAMKFSDTSLYQTSMQIAEVRNAAAGTRAYNHTYEDLEQFRRVG